MKNKEIKLTDELVVPVMDKFKVNRNEAEARLMNVMSSGIMESGNPNSKETQYQIDNLLSLESSKGASLVAFEKCVNACIEKPEFVKQYDRLTGRNMTETLKLISEGNPPKRAEIDFQKFSKFVRETVFSRLEQTN